MEKGETKTETAADYDVHHFLADDFEMVDPSNIPDYALSLLSEYDDVRCQVADLGERYVGITYVPGEGGGPDYLVSLFVMKNYQPDSRETMVMSVYDIHLEATTPGSAKCKFQAHKVATLVKLLGTALFSTFAVKKLELL